jgi:hypothetical protein
MPNGRFEVGSMHSILERGLAVIAKRLKKVSTVADGRVAGRPDWVRSTENGPSGSVVVVTRSDGRTTAYDMPNTSLVEEAGRDRDMASAGG